MAQPRLRHLLARLPEGLLAGGLLFGSTTLVNAGNYAFNLILGRWLGPAAFADASLIITLFLVITFVTVALQMAAAKFAASYAAAAQPALLAGLRRWLGGYAWLAGLAGAALFGLGAPLWQGFFHTTSAWLFVIFGLGIPFYFVQGVDRGLMQGQTHFGRLAISFQVEMWARLAIAVALVWLGWSIFGAVLGLTLSLIFAWLAARWGVRQIAAQHTLADALLGALLRACYHIPVPAPARLPAEERARIARFAVPVVAALVGQILINNSDILVVKHFFSAGEAGLYAALALIGRIVFFATWSVVTVLFPLVAQRHQRGQPHRSLLYAGVGIVLAISAGIVGATALFPAQIVQVLFGQEYLAAAPLLGMYALATAFYALGNVVINYHLSLDTGGGSLLAFGAELVQLLSLWLAHESLTQVVQVQVVVMGGLFVALLLWDVALGLLKRAAARQEPPALPLSQQV
ncbi:oligosaccharide flippase family protein [Chloroflexia bacterium SDU3-3]|nr:oligosaccharide flippase family protein [Chloroflexia bacterium SDU3-3]